MIVYKTPRLVRSLDPCVYVCARSRVHPCVHKMEGFQHQALGVSEVDITITRFKVG